MLLSTRRMVTFLMAPSAQVSLGQKISSAPLTTQGLLRGGGPPHSPPPPPGPPPSSKTLGRATCFKALH